MASYFRHDFLGRPDGARIYFQVQGFPGTKPGIILCDGLGCDGFAWKYLLPSLLETHRVVRWHYRGHGESGIPTDHERIGMDQNCEDLEAVLDAAGMPSAVVFGHSMGVQVALELHRRRPERVLALALVCGSYGRPLDTFHDTAIFKNALPYLRGFVDKYPLAIKRLNRVAMSTELAMDLALSIELNRELMKRGDLIPYFDHMARMDPAVFLRTLASLADHSALDHLPEVNVPTLVIGGEQDRFTPAWLSRRMAQLIPHSELLMIPGGSHTAPLEAPERVWKHVASFLNSLPPGSRMIPGTPPP